MSLCCAKVVSELACGSEGEGGGQGHGDGLSLFPGFIGEIDATDLRGLKVAVEAPMRDMEMDMR